MNICSACTFLLLTNCVMFIHCAAVLPGCIQGRTCFLPNCRCRGSELPGYLTSNLIPQMVVISVDGSLTETTYHNTKALLHDKINPNRCPISMTYFVSLENSIMNRVSDLYQYGAEIALIGSFRKALTFNGARQNIEKSRKRIEDEAGIPRQSVRGWRDAMLVPPGEIELNILKETGFEYDSSLFENIDTTQAVKSGSFPFTLDYGWGSLCTDAPCLSARRNGFWEVPVLNALDGSFCSLSGTCSAKLHGTRDFFQALLQDFRRHYFLDRSPMVLKIQGDWLSNPSVLNALKSFIDMALQLRDVYFVNMHQVIDWAKRPRDMSTINSFEPWMYTCQAKMAKQKTLVVAESKMPLIANSSEKEVNYTISGEDVIKATPAETLTMGNVHGAIEKIIITRREKITRLYGKEMVTVSQKNLIFIVIGGVAALFVFTAGVVFFCKTDDARHNGHSKHKATHNAIYEFASLD